MIERERAGDVGFGEEPDMADFVECKDHMFRFMDS
jgi:hypothetical protein